MENAALAASTTTSTTATSRPPTSDAAREHARRRRIAPRGAHCRLCVSLRGQLEFSRAGERRGELTRLAERTGVSRSILSRIFTSDVTPTAPVIVLLAEALGVTESCVIRHPPIWHRIVQELDGEQ